MPGMLSVMFPDNLRKKIINNDENPYYSAKIGNSFLFLILVVP